MGLEPKDFIAVMFNRDVATAGTAGTNGVIFFQFPNPAFEAEFLLSNGAYWADVCQVTLKFIRHRPVSIGIHSQFMSAVKHTKFICTGDYPRVTITARTLYQALASK